ncbi:MAG: outer membrane protein assembly factor BamE [Methylotenera sp.]|nr:outer membrane protein assembly factor BamE [Methylotenera sp.]
MRIFSVFRYSVILLAVLCASCGTALPTIKPYKLDVQQGNVVTSAMLLQLRPGMTKSQVRFIMGTPLIQDSFHGNRWDYVYQMREKGKITEQRRVILDFEDELLKTVRGDVIPKAGEQSSEKANTGTRVVEAAVPTQKKSMLDKLKFWKSDEVEVAGKVSSAAVIATPAATEAVLAAVAVPLADSTLAAATEKEANVEADAPKSVLVQDIQLPLTPQSIEQPSSQGQQVQQAVKEPLQEDAGADYANAVAQVSGASAGNEAVVQAVNDWAEAWRTKNASQYLGFYADKFKPEGAVSKKTWVAQRKQRLSGKQGDISLALEDVQVQVQDKQATVQFFQKYQSKVFSDQVTKQLNLEFDAKSNRWLIVKESVVANAQRPEVQKVLAPENTIEHFDGVIEKIGF